MKLMANRVLQKLYAALRVKSKLYVNTWDRLLHKLPFRSNKIQVEREQTLAVHWYKEHVPRHSEGVKQLVTAQRTTTLFL